MSLSASYDGVLRQQAEQTEMLQEQVWLRSGQRLLAEKVVGQTTPSLVGRAMLDFLAQYLDAVVAALYVRDKDSTARCAASPPTVSAAKANRPPRAISQNARR